eukprot:scaffold95060_cov59-Phaeocystis_antarctica.AAC.1
MVDNPTRAAGAGAAGSRPPPCVAEACGMAEPCSSTSKLGRRSDGEGGGVLATAAAVAAAAAAAATITIAASASATASALASAATAAAAASASASFSCRNPGFAGSTAGRYSDMVSSCLPPVHGGEQRLPMHGIQRIAV